MARISRLATTSIVSKISFAASAATLIVFATAQLHAQDVAAGWGVPYYGGYHASTAGESYANGMAAMVQSAGSYNLNTSQAAINYQTARSQALDNDLKGTQTYFEMRKINTSSRKAEEGRGMTSEEAFRYAAMAVPKRLAATQLDPVTGRIYWPILLRDLRYEQFTKELDKLFVLRETSHGGIGYDTYMQIQNTIDQFMAALRKNIAEYRSDDYVRAKNFLDSLAYEAKLPAV